MSLTQNPDINAYGHRHSQMLLQYQIMMRTKEKNDFEKGYSSLFVINECRVQFKFIKKLIYHKFES